MPSHRRPGRVPAPLVVGLVAGLMLVASLIAFVATAQGVWAAGYIVGAGMAPTSIFLGGIALGAAIFGPDQGP